MTDDDKQAPDPIIAESSFTARNVALHHYRKTSALVNRGPKPPPTLGQQLQQGQRVMCAKDYKPFLRLP